MKLKQLVVALLGVQLVACATQPYQNTGAGLSQKVYQSYEHLMAKESYAFSGKVTLHSQDQKGQKIAPSTDLEKKQQQAKWLTQVIGNHQISAQQKQWMAEGFDYSLQHPSVEKSAEIKDFVQTVMGRFFYHYDGVVDLGRGQISLDSTMGYKAKNAQASVKIPFALDLRQDKAYADLSALSPFLTDPRYDGRYIELDFKSLIKQWGFDKKAALELIRDYMLVNAALAKETDYQKLPLTTQHKQQNAAEYIRYTVSYEELMAQYGLYFYLNENYLKQIFNSHSEQSNQAPTMMNNPLMILSNIGNLDHLETEDLPKLAVASDENVENQPETHDQLAVIAKNRLLQALEIASIRLNEQEILNQEAELAADASDAALELAELAENALSEQESMITALARFDFYASDDKLVSAQQMKKIVAEQPEAYQQLIAEVKKNIKELGFPSNQPLIIDMLFDAKGRLIQNDMKMDFSVDQAFFKGFQINMETKFYDYGQARIDEKVFKNATTWQQAVNENTLMGMKKIENKRHKIDPSNLESKTWHHQQRYHKLAESLLKQNMSFIDAYTLVYRYAYLLENDSENWFDDQQALKQLNDTGRWNAIYFAQEYALPLTPQHNQEYEDSPEDWPYYDEDLSDRIWEEFYSIMGDQRYAQLYQQLHSKYKDDAQLFSAIYYAMDIKYEKERHEFDEVEYPEGFDNFVKTLGQIAIEDMKTQQIDPNKIAKFGLEEIVWFEEEIYEKTYAELLKHRK